jgi:hypothetical protein
MQVERVYLVAIQRYTSGKRERNTLATYLELVDNDWKRSLIHDIDGGTQVIPIESFSVREGPMVHQLVGGVTAHQGDDGYQARERDLAHWN